MIKLFNKLLNKMPQSEYPSPDPKKFFSLIVNESMTTKDRNIRIVKKKVTYYLEPWFKWFPLWSKDILVLENYETIIVEPEGRTTERIISSKEVTPGEAKIIAEELIQEGDIQSVKMSAQIWGK